MVDSAPIGSAVLVADGDPNTGPDLLRVVLCGSFRRSPDELRETFASLASRYQVLSPLEVTFDDPQADFVRLPHESDESIASIEGRHLRAIEAADFVWLFCPDGYVGRSAAMEVGFASAIGVPVLTDCLPADATLTEMVTVVDAMANVEVILAPRPGQPLGSLQRYYGRVAGRRGWANESPRDTLLLLTEELGELARAVRKGSGLARDGGYDSTPIGHELADVQLYLVHLANALGVDLASAVTAKEAINAARHARRESAA